MTSAVLLLAAVVRAPEWIVAGPWGTPAALSLGGLSCEADLRPNAGDRYIAVNFDSVQTKAWRTVARDERAGYLIETNCHGFAWTEGSAYAALWIMSPDDRAAKMRYTTSGHDLSVRLNGREVSATAHKRSPVKRTKVKATTDQGNEFEVEVTSGGLESEFELPLRAGVNRLLVKIYTKQPAGSDIVFDAEFGNADGLSFATANPTTDAVRHARIMEFDTEVCVDAVANLPHAGDAIRLTTRAAWPVSRKHKPKKGQPSPPEPMRCEPFTVKCIQVIEDIDGAKIARRAFEMSFPGTNTVEFGTAPARGYYQVRTFVLEGDDRVLAALKPDGFSVIGGTKARRERQAQGLNKLASCFYWINSKNCDDPFFPWMGRIGFLHNVGGNCSDEALFAHGRELGLSLTADFLDPWCGAKPEGRRMAAASASKYTRYFKAWNEIDISHFRFKNTTTNWVKRVKSEWEAVHAADRNAIYTGPTLVRVGNSDWFAECLKLGWADYVDVWDVHAYPMHAPRLGDRHVTNSDNESGSGVEIAMRNVLGRENDKKFIMGEWGARSSHGREARKWQTQMSAKMIAWLGSNPNYLMGGFLIPWQHDWGDIAVAHQPAEAAYYTAAALIDGFPFSRFTDGLDPERFEAGLFGRTLMVWKRGSGSESRRFRPPFEGELVIVDAIGRVKPLPRGADGLVSVDFSDWPVYILPAEEYARLTK